MFCTQCGTKLDDDARFCTNCGVAIDGVGGAAAEDAGETGEAGVSELDAVDPTAVLPDSFWADDDTPAEPTAPVFPVAETVAMPSAAFAPPASQTIPMPSVASAPAASPASFVASASAATSDKKSPSRGVIVAVVAVVCALAIGVGVGVGVVTHGTGGGPFDAGSTAASQDVESSAASSAASSSASSAGSASSAASSASSAASSQSATADDVSIKSMLTSYYDQLSGFDGEVRACATEFNNTYASASMSARQASLATCENLESRVDSRLEQVKALNVPQSSAYYAKFRDICTLYDDLSHRIGVIVEAWEICVRYDDPSAHQDEITAPIARDNDGQSNIYFRDYEQRYPNARP
ncbi:MAG: zinc ribbon domain-containing protein [Eggerthellaceae bacterium]|nr:zinc ribbon domain-containing protein [Eggerthellaceae bacterium]